MHFESENSNNNDDDDDVFSLRLNVFPDFKIV